MNIHCIAGNHINNSGTRGVMKREIESHVRSIIPAEILDVKDDSSNPGCIYITKASLDAWLSRQKYITGKR